MWNPFLTDQERADLRRGRQLIRLRAPRTYWMTQGFIYFCAITAAAVLVWVLFQGAYWQAARMASFVATVYFLTAWLVARNIRKLR